MEAVANIYKDRGYYRVLLNAGAVRLINSQEICFDRKNLVMRVPTIFDNKTYKISSKKIQNAAFAFCYHVDMPDDITGKYLIEQDGDEFYLVKK